MKYASQTTTFALSLLTLSLASLALAHPGPASSAGQLETCLAAVSKIRPGVFVKVEYLSPSADGVPTYEIEVRAADGSEWEFMCDATAGHIYEIETEVASSAHERFHSQAQVNEEQARSSAQALYPGEVQEVEYEIESTGEATYEFDIVDAAGTEWKVEVDAASGKVVEVHVEQWELGEEADERKR